MLPAEARWLGRALAQLDLDQLSPMLNVGSHTKDFRTRVQPWIDAEVMAPLEARGVRVECADLRPGEGVDHVGDLTDPAFLEQLGRRQFRAILCSNLLEHVPEPEKLADALQGLLAPGGLLIFSGPCRFPYHADPIDNMYRPTPQALTRTFPGMEVVESAEVPCGTFATYLAGRLLASPGRTLQDVRRKSGDRAAAPSPAHETLPTALLVGDRPDGKNVASRLTPWLAKRFTVTCAILRASN